MNGKPVEQLSQSQVVHLMRSLPLGPVILQVSRQEAARLSSDDSSLMAEVVINTWPTKIIISMVTGSTKKK